MEQQGAMTHSAQLAAYLAKHGVTDTEAGINFAKGAAWTLESPLVRELRGALEETLAYCVEHEPAAMLSRGTLAMQAYDAAAGRGEENG